MFAALSLVLPIAAAQPAGAAHPVWTAVPSPNVGTGGANVLQSVSCSSASHCMSVGNDDGATGGNHGDVILRRTGGKWKIVTTHHHADGWNLKGVSCPTSTWCMSVGSYDPHPDLGFSPAAESIKNGTEHEALTGLPKTAHNADALSSVGCRSSHFCVAVGVAQSGAGSAAPLIEQWNGHRWSKDAAPDPGKGSDNAGIDGSTLTDVACAASNACVAVGYSDIVTGQTSLSADVTSRYTFAVRYNGKSWHAIKPKNPLAYHRPGKVAKQQVSLSSVACISAKECFATGDSTVATLNMHGFIERWNGKSWSVAYKTSSAQLALASIACGSSSSCDVVTHDGHPGDIPPMAKYEHILGWNGHHWHAEAVDQPATGLLNDVGCGSAAKCFAVGSSMPTDITQVTEILRK